MKKLIIAATVICAAAFAQAAQFSWGFGSSLIEGPDDAHSFEGYLDGGHAILYIGSTIVAEADQDGENFNFGVFDNSAVDTTGLVQTLAAGDISESFVGQAYKIVLQTTDGAWEMVYEGTSTYGSVAQAGQPSLNFEKFVNNDDAPGEWKAVPEPTSGLLLLLGVAGLALRRRRA